jgi:hypothetical protein
MIILSCLDESRYILLGIRIKSWSYSHRSWIREVHMRLTVYFMFNLFFLSTPLWGAQKQEDALSSETFNGLKFRCIGPAVSPGRIIDFAVNPWNPSEYYVAVASGGVWKTTNAGEEFKPQLDQLKILISTEMKNLENKLDLAGAPWTPGRIQEWQSK